MVLYRAEYAYYRGRDKRERRTYHFYHATKATAITDAERYAKTLGKLLHSKRLPEMVRTEPFTRHRITIDDVLPGSEVPR